MKGIKAFRGITLSLVGLAILALVVSWLLGLEMDLAQLLREARNSPELFWGAALLYALCLAIPYMPGLELGLLMMMVFGRPGVVVAYLGTLAGLSLAFQAGRLIRSRASRSQRFSGWLSRAESWDQDSQQVLQGSAVSRRLARFINQRGGTGDYLLLGLLINLPGNWVLGGGGGIALVSGLTGRLRWRGFFLTVMLATCVIPILAFFGIVELERWFMPEATSP